MKFSIVITTYNRLPFLKLALQSALNQTLKSEVVVVDDCSQDGTEDYVRTLGNLVVYYRHCVNQGRGISVNQGVQLAQGDWIKFLDDDDYLETNCLEEISKALKLYPDTVIASCQAIRVDQNQSPLDSTIPVGEGRIYHVLQEDIHYRMLLEQLPFGLTTQVAVKRDAFLHSGGWDSNLPSRGFETIDSWVRIAQYGDAVFVNQPLSHYTLWSGNSFKQLSVKERFEANISLKSKIYRLVHHKYYHQLPERQELHNFLKLHWAMVGLKNGLFAQTCEVAKPFVFSRKAWKHLFQEIWQKKVKPWSDKVIYLNNNDNDNFIASLNHSQKLVVEYYHLATLSQLSTAEADRMTVILEEAQSNEFLSLLIHEIDYVIAKELNFLEEDDPAYYEQQREQIIELLLNKVSASSLQQSQTQEQQQLEIGKALSYLK